MALGKLSATYESNGDPHCISTGYGDLGGKSYGAYQLSSARNNGEVDTSSLERYMNWLRDSGNPNYIAIADALCEHAFISDGFDAAWRSIDRGVALASQHDYIKTVYYDVACELLAEQGFHAEKHSKAMQDVIWSRAVQYGASEVPNLFNEALAYVPSYQTYWNLTWVDDRRFDYDLIVGIYEANKSDEWISRRLSDDVRAGVYARMDAEKADALEMFKAEL